MRPTYKILIAFSLLLNVVFITLVMVFMFLPEVVAFKNNALKTIKIESKPKIDTLNQEVPILTLDSVNNLINSLDTNATSIKPEASFAEETTKAKSRASSKSVTNTVVKSKKPLSEYSVALYPTKAASEINLNLSGYANQSFGVFIISKRGKVEAYYEFKGNSTSERRMSLDISRLDNGTYFAHLVSNGDRVIKKFVKV